MGDRYRASSLEIELPAFDRGILLTNLSRGYRRSLGRNLDKSIYFISPVVGIIGGYYFSPELGLIAASSHLLGGLYLSPDLDLKSLPWKRWGMLHSTSDKNSLVEAKSPVWREGR